jgi:L-threonylcarbamoyladenylate synthase
VKRVTVDPVHPDAAVLAAASRVLAAGGIVAFPTETFYGLGAAALNRRAVQKVFALKGRPASRPLLVLVDGIEMAEGIADIPDRARPLIERHWPGPLTLVFRARPVIPNEVTAGGATVGVRWTSHPIARGLVAALGMPITAPSANPTDAAPPTSADDVARDLGHALDLLVDGGATTGGLPSTVLDVTVDPPRILRAGAARLAP